MKQMKVSAIVGLAVTVLAVVIAFAFSFATLSYQAEVAKLRKMNKEYEVVIRNYQGLLESIKLQLEEAPKAVK
ncbi:MAG: hypothetical protein WC732_01095 [Candidatus Omnitrophota bacterium]